MILIEWKEKNIIFFKFVKTPYSLVSAFCAFMFTTDVLQNNSHLSLFLVAFSRIKFNCTESCLLWCFEHILIVQNYYFGWAHVP